MNSIYIPNLKELKSSYVRNDKNMFSTCDVLDFYIENNALLYLLNNHGGVGKMRCLKNCQDKYKVFAYKTLGVLSHTVYFLLDINKQILFFTTDNRVNQWAEYLSSGGSYEKALEYNKSIANEFDPLAGI